MSSLLTSVIGSETKTKEYIDECKKLNIKLFKPSINKSNCYYVKENDGSFRSNSNDDGNKRWLWKRSS